MNQKNVYAGWILGIFFLGVAALMAYTTWHAVYNGTQDKVMAWLSLFVFDAGAYAGYMMLIGNAKGAEQRAAAQVVLWVDFALAAAMVGGALDKLPTGAIGYIVWISIAFNLLAVYYYKTHSPETMKQMQAQDEDDAKETFLREQRKILFEESSKQAKLNLQRQARNLGALWAIRTQIDFKRALDMPLEQYEQDVFDKDVIDLKALPVPDTSDMPIQQSFGFADLLKSFFTRRQRMPLQNTHSKQDTSLPSDQPQGNPQNQEE